MQSHVPATLSLLNARSSLWPVSHAAARSGKAAAALEGSGERGLRGALLSCRKQPRTRRQKGARRSGAHAGSVPPALLNAAGISPARPPRQSAPGPAQEAALTPPALPQSPTRVSAGLFGPVWFYPRLPGTAYPACRPCAPRCRELAVPHPAMPGASPSARGVKAASPQALSSAAGDSLPHRRRRAARETERWVKRHFIRKETRDSVL